MDYGARFNTDVHGLGKYDYAAIRFGYGQIVDTISQSTEPGSFLASDVFFGDYNDHPRDGWRHREHQQRGDRRRALPGGQRLHARGLPGSHVHRRHPGHARAPVQVLLRRVHRQHRLQALGRRRQPGRDHRQHDRSVQELLLLRRVHAQPRHLEHRRVPEPDQRSLLRALHRGVPVLLLLRQRLPGQLPQRRSAARVDRRPQQPGRDPADARARAALRDGGEPESAGAARSQRPQLVRQRHRFAGRLRRRQALLRRVQPRLLLPHHARRLTLREAGGAAGADHDPVAVLPRRHVRGRQPVLDQLLPHLQGSDAQSDLGRDPQRPVDLWRVRQQRRVHARRRSSTSTPTARRRTRRRCTCSRARRASTRR